MSAGGATAASDSRGTICLLSAEWAPQISELRGAREQEIGLPQYNSAVGDGIWSV